MSRIYYTGLVVLFILSLAACGSNEPENAGSNATVVPAEPEDPIEIDDEDSKVIMPPIEISTDEGTDTEPIPDEEFELKPNRG